MRGSASSTNRVQPEPAPRLNEAPAPAPELPEEDYYTSPAEEAEDPNTTIITPEEVAPVNNQAIIAIGLYGRQRNVDKQVRRLSEDGYTPYTREEGRLTRVGIQFPYAGEENMQQLLRDIQRKYAEEAFVMMVNGEERGPE